MHQNDLKLRKYKLYILSKLFASDLPSIELFSCLTKKSPRPVTHMFDITVIFCASLALLQFYNFPQYLLLSFTCFFFKF